MNVRFNVISYINDCDCECWLEIFLSFCPYPLKMSAIIIIIKFSIVISLHACVPSFQRHFIKWMNSERSGEHNVHMHKSKHRKRRSNYQRLLFISKRRAWNSSVRLQIERRPNAMQCQSTNQRKLANFFFNFSMRHCCNQKFNLKYSSISLDLQLKINKLSFDSFVSFNTRRLCACEWLWSYSHVEIQPRNYVSVVLDIFVPTKG